eukprot:EC691929.1.p6 GENE.EC691929.1~~EC691929.1.p6  ORF type:complete len:50 (-),score=5.49 EC691929.1:316-465(-)
MGSNATANMRVQPNNGLRTLTETNKNTGKEERVASDKQQHGQINTAAVK